MRWTLLLLLVVAVGGCRAEFDRDQARLCRIVAARLAGDDGPIEIVAQQPLPPVGGPAIRVVYRGADPHGGASFVECSFGTGDGRLELTAVRTPEGLLSQTRLFVLNRFWINTDDALKGDPLPVEGAADAPALPAGTGYATQQLVNAIPGAAVYGLLAAAYSLVYGLVGRINLAFGAFAAIGGVAAVIIVLACGPWPVGIAIALAVVGSMACAGFHGIAASRLIFARLHRSTGQQGLVATIGLALFLGEYLRLIQGSQPIWIAPLLHTPFSLARDPGFLVTITPIAALVSALAAGTAGLLLWAMKYTGFGRDWRAYSDDPRAAALFGISRDAILGRTFAIATALAGLAGCITSLFFGEVGLAYATTLGLKALAAAVLGGIGSIPGAFLGGLFIGLVEAGWSASFPIVYRDLVVFCILIATLIWRPGGFLGYRDLVPRRV